MEEEFENEAVLYFEDNNLIVSFGTPDDLRTATMELKTEEERDLIKTVLSDANLWANFLGSLSAAYTQHK